MHSQACIPAPSPSAPTAPHTPCTPHALHYLSTTYLAHIRYAQVDENGFIVDSKFKTFGCGSAIASSSVATEWVKGKTLDEVIKIKNSDIAKHLSLPPVKLHCSMLAEDAIKVGVGTVVVWVCSRERRRCGSLLRSMLAPMCPTAALQARSVLCTSAFAVAGGAQQYA
jgi:hypothetical protein